MSECFGVFTFDNGDSCGVDGNAQISAQSL
jgi:hypothetical protein